jgi:hypothetical protein
MIASYFYLRHHAKDASQFTMANFPLALVATGFILGAGAATRWYTRQIARAAAVPTLVGLTATFLLTLGFLVLAGIWGSLSGLKPAASATDSAIALLLGAQLIVSGVLLVFLTLAQLWAWIAPGDVRGRAVALNASLVSYFSAAGWVCVVLALAAGSAL